MFKQKISIRINSEVDRNKLYDEFEILMGNYCQTGQVQSDYETPFLTDNELISYQTTIERNSLSKKYNNEYINLRIKNLEVWCNTKLETEVIGTVPNSKRVCKCKIHEFFILFTFAFNETSPIECGTCAGVMPIYKLKNLVYNDRYNLLAWEKNYNACDHLQLGCTVGERWATKQMSDPSSELSKQGIKICNVIQDATNVPTYYYLHNYRHISHLQDKNRKCPSCGGDWLLNKQLNNFYDFMCNKCKLLSSFSPVS